MSRRTLASLVIAACTASWGAIGIVVRELHMPALTIAFFQELQGVLVAALVAVLWRPALLRPPRPAVTLLGLLMAVHFAFFYGAIGQTSVASAVLITYAAPIFIAVLAPALLREHVPGTTVAALAVSAVGVALISATGGGGGGGVRAIGLAMALMAAITYALYVVLLKRLTADVNPVTVMLWQSAASALALSPAALIGHYTLGGREIGYLALLGIVLTGLTGFAYIAALRSVPATAAGILGYLEPLSAVVLAAIVLGEGLGPAVAVGGAAIVAAGLVVVIDGARTEAEPVAPVPHVMAEQRQ